MTTATELTDEIVGIVQDDKYDDSIPVRIISASKYLSSKLLFPQLESSADIVTTDDSNTAAMPADFMRNLFYAENSKGNEVKVYNNVALLLRTPWGLPVAGKGDIYGVTIKEADLFYSQRANDIVSIRYHRKPNEAAIEDFFLDIAGEAILNHVCWNVFAQKEDGIDGQKINTGYYYEQLRISIDDLRQYLRQGVSMPMAPVVRGNFL